LEVVCDEHGIGGGGDYVPRIVLFDFEPGVIYAPALCYRTASSSARAVS
jgi:hypothetical protein